MNDNKKIIDAIDAAVEELLAMSDEEFNAELDKCVGFESEIYTAMFKKLEEIV